MSNPPKPKGPAEPKKPEPLHDPREPPMKDPPKEPIHDPVGDPTHEPQQPFGDPDPVPGGDIPPQTPDRPTMQALANARYGSCESIRMKATRQGTLPRLIQAWLVACCTTTSPALRWTSPSSSIMSISPDMMSA